MRPITDSLPKPLVEVRGKPLIVWHLEHLSAAGFREVVINISHLGALIENALADGRRWGVDIHWSREDVPLETAGGIARALPLLGREPFLLVNADVYCDIPFSDVRNAGLGGHLGHLVLVPNPGFRPEGDFSLQGGRIGNTGAPRYTYSGIALLEPRLLSEVVPGSKAPLAPILRRAAEAGALSGALYPGRWDDVGTPERLAELNRMKAT